MLALLRGREQYAVRPGHHRLSTPSGTPSGTPWQPSAPLLDPWPLPPLPRIFLRSWRATSSADPPLPDPWPLPPLPHLFQRLWWVTSSASPPAPPQALLPPKAPLCQLRLCASPALTSPAPPAPCPPLSQPCPLQLCVGGASSPLLGGWSVASVNGDDGDGNGWAVWGKWGRKDWGIVLVQMGTAGLRNKVSSVSVDGMWRGRGGVIELDHVDW
ncbi:hypothetical protein WOLCODRAFT_150630 [Wolfiporia cocos MD-104 SS10]|uniref:Uncharacterized protein n=1 Tax=Wolfiporia cocos (strain MD-104) TaxID=742152 RepID=A0A2H3JFA7_WOLCO|nr:hypothetical protein WOLCODRAFT_150630 [Wolfiporia cocos MD-104 SS10]